MTNDQSMLGPTKYTFAVAKWENGRTPDDGPPDRTVRHSTWIDSDGSEITDAARIAALEAQIAPQQEF